MAEDAQPFFDTDHLKADLKGRSIRGGAVTMTAQACKFVLALASTMLLARLLTPDDFGLLAMIMAFMGFVLMFKDLGLSMATVQRAKIDHKQVSTLFWINLLIGFTLAAVIAALGPAMAWFYGEARLTRVAVALSGILVLAGLSVQHQALLRRQMRFVALAAVDLSSLAAGATAAVAAALLGAGYWALVCLHLVTAAVNALGMWVACGWRPGLPVRGSGARSMVAFGGNITGFNIVNYFARNLDKILIGRYCGAGQLGLYERAYKLLLLPIQQINVPISSVAIPTLSRLQNDPERYRRYYLTAVKSVAYITMPLVAMMIVFSREIIQLVLGDQWLDASRLFAILAFAALIQPVGNTTGWVLVSLNRTRRLLSWGLIATPIIVMSFVIGLPWGPQGVALGYTMCVYVIRYPGFLYCFKDTPIRASKVLYAIHRPFILALIIEATTYGVKAQLSPMGYAWSIPASLVAGLCAFIAILSLWTGLRRDLAEILTSARVLVESFRAPAIGK